MHAAAVIVADCDCAEASFAEVMAVPRELAASSIGQQRGAGLMKGALPALLLGNRSGGGSGGGGGLCQ